MKYEENSTRPAKQRNKRPKRVIFSGFWSDISEQEEMEAKGGREVRVTPGVPENDVKKAKKLINRLKIEAEEGTPVLVEGMNDSKALKELGIKGKLIHIKRRNLGLIAERVSKHSKRAIILTDPDKEGRKLAAQVARLLEQYGVHPVMTFRRMCRLLRKSAVEHL